MKTLKLLQDAGLPDLPILMTAKHLKKIASSSGKEKANYHNVPVDIIKKLPKYISEPVLIADSFTRDDSIVVVTEAVDKENRPVIAAILLDGKNFQSFLNRIGEENAVIYWNNKKSQ